ncbi:hypothetical protein BaRGS_00002648 [Batillaria attramentaria]|uniref:TTF-type domain-containing protein n=1 Tax=Batillaria attramentaria TaxID=370345 RepID=A0ABD0M343_9CAEN
MPPKKRPKPEKGQSFLTAMFKKSNVSQSASASDADDPMEGGSEELPLSSDAPSGTPSPPSHEPDLGAKSKDVENESTKAPARQLVSSWFKVFPWLVYNEETRTMFCSVCMNDGVAKNSFTRGCGNLRKSALSEHAETSDHKRALQTPVQVQNQMQAEKMQLTREEHAILQAARAVHWLVSEDLPLSKFPSFMSLLQEYKVEDVDKLLVSNNTTYSSRDTAMDILETLAEDVDEKASVLLKESPFVSVLADESTDITIKKRMGVFAKTVTTDMIPTTRFLANRHVENGTGQVIAEGILDEMSTRGVDPEKIIGFGSDGAAAMTGTRNGAAGILRHVNPHMLNSHCIAHRLALCTSQAAKDVPALQEFQETLTTLYYYFKGSANRNEALSRIQELLETPQLKIKEIHSVRWLSFYTALDTVFRSLDALLTYLAASDRRRDPKAVALQKKIASEKFISLAHILMDIIPIVTALNQFFQKKDIDLALIKVKVNQCISDLETMKTEQTGEHRELLKQELTVVEGARYYKGHAVTGCKESDITSATTKFIDNLVRNIKTRFPDSELMSAFGCLGMRPISFLSGEDLTNWGTSDLEKLLDHFGEERKVTWTDSEGVEQAKKSAPVVDKEATRREWKDLKETVNAQHYPRDNFAKLWQLISRFHKESFPNLSKLAQIALVLPVHTADVERGFSNQNIILTAKRNRLNLDTQNMLLKQKIEGQKKRDDAYLWSIVKRWKQKRERRLFKSKTSASQLETTNSSS